MAAPSHTVPVLFLKTRSQPHDSYEDYFTSTNSSFFPGGPDGVNTQLKFVPLFVPVLEHRLNTDNLAALEQDLSTGALGQKYGGMIFTSQRAIEAWSGVVKKIERASKPWLTARSDGDSGKHVQGGAPPRTPSDSTLPSIPHATNALFPLYAVGPATSRGLQTLVTESSALFSSPLTALRPTVVGDHTGNGANLAQYILEHYNGLHTHHSGRAAADESQGREDDDLSTDTNDNHVPNPQPVKRPLLFLVGETRRDVIPKTLTDPNEKLAPEERVGVDEVEVYSTRTVDSAQNDVTREIEKVCGRHVAPGATAWVVVVVFSPQGCDAMLRSLGYLDEDGNLTRSVERRWRPGQDEDRRRRAVGEADQECQKRDVVRETRFVVVTIGPTTRDHLKQTFGFDPDVCAETPSPQGVGDALVRFLRKKALIDSS